MTRELLTRINYSNIYHLVDDPDVIFFSGGMMIDADGSPHAYCPRGSGNALDDLANAGHPGNWWGIATDNGKSSGQPIVQTQTDPAPGFFVSTTALEDTTKKSSDPARYVDSEKVPFIVLPSKPGLGLKLADLGLVFNPTVGKSSVCVYADVGPANQIGEGSVALANSLQINPSARYGGQAHGVVYVLFARSSIGWPKPIDDMNTAVQKAFQGWGGMDTLTSVMSEIDWSHF